jgi:hypothetical protein
VLRRPEVKRLQAMFGRQRNVWLLVVVFSVAGFSARAHAQAGGELLCSAGSNDGNTCQTHADCPGGACVVVQGVCNDQNGYPCDCPGATCNGTACTGGPFSGLSCDTAFNCDTGVACQGSQKVCVGGSASGALLPPGYPCLNNQQCDSSQCRSTGLVCKAGTAFSNYPCGQDADCCTPATSCPVGACFSPATVPTPTATVTASATPTAQAVRLAASIGATDTTLTVDNASSLPNSGTVRIDSELIIYTAKSGNQLTGLTRGADGTTAASHSKNALVTLVIPSTPTVTPGLTPPPHPTRPQPHGVLYQAIGEGAGCATVGDGGWSFAMLAGVVVLWAARRRPGARQPLG